MELLMTVLPNGSFAEFGLTESVNLCDIKYARANKGND